MKFIIISIIFYILINQCSSQTNLDYCRLFRDHTMCKTPLIGPNCKTGFRREIPSAEGRKDILKWHNDYRGMATNGTLMIGNETLPRANDMIQLSWDNEIARIAQRFANQCDLQNDCALCRRALNGRFADVGQIIFFSRTPDKTVKINFVSTLNQTFARTKSFDKELIASYLYYDEDYEKISQILWAETRYVGCGGSVFTRWGDTFSVLVCNYEPAGNIIGLPVYQEGFPCSACPTGSKCVGNNPLCAFPQ